LPQLLQKLSANPANILHIPGGTISEGAPADLTLIDPHLEYVVDAAQFKSLGKNSPFLGWKLKGRAVMTIVAGVVKWTLDG
jgi:dihydroorotase